MMLAIATFAASVIPGWLAYAQYLGNPKGAHAPPRDGVGTAHWLIDHRSAPAP